MGYAAPAEAQTTTRLATSVVVVWFVVALLFVGLPAALLQPFLA